MSFLKARKIVGSYMRENSYASVAQRVVTTNQENEYRTLMEKLIQLEANDWPKFQEHLKKLHSAEFYQAPAEQQVENGERSNIVQTKTHVGSTTPTLITPKSAKSPIKQPLQKSPILPPKSIKDRLKKTCHPKDLNNLNKNHKLPSAKLGKYWWTPKWTMKDQEAHSIAYKNQTVQCSGIDKTPTK